MNIYEFCEFKNKITKENIEFRKNLKPGDKYIEYFDIPGEEFIVYRCTSNDGNLARLDIEAVLSQPEEQYKDLKVIFPI